jgi:hypothetical protein
MSAEANVSIEEVKVVSSAMYDRQIVIVERKGDWPTHNIAFFKSTGESNGKFKGIFANTFFPMLGCFVDKNLTPIDPRIDKSVTLSENYIVKLGGTFPIIFKGDIKNIPNWIEPILSKYINYRLGHELHISLQPIDIFQITDVDQLKMLKEIYSELFIIYTCLSTYFSSIWQVQLSIALSNTTQNGVWIKSLSIFATFLGTPYIIPVFGNIQNEESFLEYLQSNHAQCDLKQLSTDISIIKPSRELDDGLTRNEQLIDQQLRIYEKRKIRKTQAAIVEDPELEDLTSKRRRGGKSKRKRKKQRKLKSRKYKN